MEPGPLGIQPQPSPREYRLMSSESTSGPAQEWPVLSHAERRALGVLIEKQKTTPDVYPLSLNALVTGCNQKSNRDPVMNLEDHELESTMEGLQKLALATRVESGRVDKWRHLLYEQWNVGKLEIAVLAELLLRGPQTEGELRGRVSRMEPIDDLEVLRNVLRPLANRGLVVFLGAEGRRGTLITHGFHDPAELERIKSHVPPPSAVGPSPRASGSSAASTAVEELKSEVATLRGEVQQLQHALAELHLQLRTIQGQIGGQV